MSSTILYNHDLFISLNHHIHKHTKDYKDTIYHTNFYVYFTISIFLQLFDIVH